VKLEIEFTIPDDLFRLYWRVSIPDPYVEWGGFEQTISSIDIGMTKPYVLYEDQAYENFVVRWYRWDDVPAGTFTVTYTANFISGMDFYGREPWENDAEEHDGTYWVVDRFSTCIPCYDDSRQELLQDAGVDEHLCGTWAGVDLGTAFGMDYPGDCSSKSGAVVSILRGWNIPTGQPTGIMLPGTAQLGGMSCPVSGSGGLHTWVKHWCDDEQEWHFLEPGCMATGQSPQAFCWGDEADETWTVWAWHWIVEGEDPYVQNETIPVATSEMSWDWVQRVGTREAPTNASGLWEYFASQCFSSMGKSNKRTDAPDCDSHVMVSVPTGSKEEWQVQVTPNPTMRFTRFLTGEAEATVKVFDVRGRRVYQGLGADVHWDTHHVSPGIYFARVSVGEREEVRKVTVLR